MTLVLRDDNVVDVAAREVPEDVAAARAMATTDLVVTPHPLTFDGRRVLQAVVLRPGETLVELLERHGVRPDERWVVSIAGAMVPSRLWAVTRPKHGHLIECRRLMGEDVVRAFALVAVIWAAPQLAALAFTSGTLLHAFATASIIMIGSAVVNRLLPPSRARLNTYDRETGSTYSLAGGRNRARMYEPLGLLFGVTKVIPDYAALPYTWFEGDEQYQALRFDAGINCKSLADIKIGQTSLASFSGVIESRTGFASGNTDDADWANVDTVAGAVLDAPTAPGPWVTRTTSVDTVRWAVDVVSSLYAMNDDGELATAYTWFDLEYRLVGAPSWTSLGNITLASTTTKPVRRTITSDQLPAGQYEVRLRKTAANIATARSSNAMEFAALKSYQAPSNDTPGYPQFGLRIKASAQLSGVIDELSWVATALDVPVWNGTAFVTQPSRNPGAQMLQFARGIFDPTGRLQAGMGLPDAQIDLESLKSFTLHCAANGYVFDHWFDQPLSAYDTLEAIANAGMGSVSYHSGRLGVVWMAQGQPREAVVNMATIKAGTFRVDYMTRDLSDELEVSWFDRDAAWAPKSLRLLAPGVTVPRQTARYAPVGVTTEAAAARAGRLSMAQNVYQRKAVTWQTDLEHLAYRRFSVVALSHDMTRWGQGGRVKAAVNASGVVTLTLDEPVPEHGTRYIGLRIPGETGYRIFGVNAFVGETRVVTLSSTWPSGVPVPGDSAGNPAHDTIWIYDFRAEPGQRLRVVSVEPSNDLKGATVTAVPEPDAFWTYVNSGAYTVSAPPALPGQVVAQNIRVTQRRLDLNVANSTELNITFDVSGPFGSAEVWGAPSNDELLLLGTTMTPRFGPVLVGNDGTFDIEVRPFGRDGRRGTPASISYNVTLGVPVGLGSSLLVLRSTAMTFTFDTAGTAVPGSQSISFTAVLSNLTGTATFVCELFNAAGVSMGLVTMGGTGNTRTLSLAQFGAAARAQIDATLSGYTDRITVNRLVVGPPVAGPVATPGNFFIYASALSPSDAPAAIEFRANGEIFEVVNAVATKVGEWYSPPATAIGAAFEMRFDLTLAEGLTGGESDNAVAAWSALSAYRFVSLATTENAGGSRRRIYAYTIRNSVSGAQVSAGLVQLEAEVNL